MKKWIKLAAKTIEGNVSADSAKLARGARRDLWGNNPPAPAPAPAPATKTLIDYLLEPQQPVAAPDPVAIAAQAEVQRQEEVRAEEARIRNEAEAKRIAEERINEEARSLKLAQAQSEKQAAADRENEEREAREMELAQAQSEKQAAADRASTLQAQREAAQAQLHALKEAAELERINKQIAELQLKTGAGTANTPPAYESVDTRGDEELARSLQQEEDQAKAEQDAVKEEAGVASANSASASSAATQLSTEDATDAEKWANQILDKQEDMHWLKNVTNAFMQEDIAGYFARKLMANKLTAEELRDALKASNVEWLKGPLDTYCFNHYSINGEGREVVPALATILHTVDNDGPWPVPVDQVKLVGQASDNAQSNDATGKPTHPYDFDFTQ